MPPTVDTPPPRQSDQPSAAARRGGMRGRDWRRVAGLESMPAAGSGKDNEPLVFLGGCVLAAIAGFLNVVLIAGAGVPVTHMTGTVSRLSSDLGAGNSADILFVLPVFGCFIIGAGISGVVIGKASLRLGEPYGIAMMLEAGLLVLAAVVVRWSITPGVLLVAMAAGLQNAMASSYGGLIVRTTHLTGIATDLGFLLGQWLRHRDVAGWKLLLLLLLLGAFFVGGVVGHFAWLGLGLDALWLPAIVLGVAGGGYFARRVQIRARHGQDDEACDAGPPSHGRSR
ncbi:MAG: YoaK family protein [Phycisphaerales bacterium]